MATYPGMIKNRGVRSSTIVAGNQTNASGAIVNTGAITSKARVTAGLSRIQSEDVTDKTRLVKVINDLQSAQDASTQAIRSNPLSSPCIQRGCSAKSGETVAVPHTLKRPYSDWFLSRVTGGWTLVEIAETTAYPASQFLLLMNTGTVTVTFNVAIVGD